MASKKFDDLSDKIVDLVGGRDNVSYFTHCVSRLRFNVKDRGLVKAEEVEGLPGVVGAQWVGDQFQAIIGTDVSDAYRAVCEKTGLGEVGNDEEGRGSGKLSFKRVFNSVLDAISGSVAPTIPLLIVGGMLKMLVLIFDLVGMSPDVSGYQIVSFVADSAFYFLPVFVGGFAAKKFGTNIAFGMIIGAMLLHPTFVSMANSGDPIDLFGIPVYSTTYASTVFPAILSVYVMSHVERFVSKHSPAMFKGILVPLVTIVVMTPVVLCALGPLGAIIGHYLSVAVLWLYDTTGFIGVALFTAALPFIIVTGMHFGFFPYSLNAFATAGKEPFYCAAQFIFNISVGAASLAVALRTNDEDSKSTNFGAAFTAIVAGVSEPALFGVIFRYKKALWCTVLGCLAGGAFAGLFGSTCYAYVSSFGLVGIPAFISSDMGNFISSVLAILIGGVVTFITTFIAFKDGVFDDAE